MHAWYQSWKDEEGELVPAIKDLKYDIGNMLNKALAAIEEENDKLAGVLKNNINFNEIKGGWFKDAWDKTSKEIQKGLDEGNKKGWKLHTCIQTVSQKDINV